jgi:hypothetical protein
MKKEEKTDRKKRKNSLLSSKHGQGQKLSDSDLKNNVTDLKKKRQKTRNCSTLTLHINTLT